MTLACRRAAVFAAVGHSLSACADPRCSDPIMQQGSVVEWTYTNPDIGAVAVAVDEGGGIIVLGRTRLIALDSDGKELWTRALATIDDDGVADEALSLEAMVVDAGGNIYVGGTDGSDAIVRAFGPGGDSLWTFRDAPALEGPNDTRSLGVSDLALSGGMLCSAGFDRPSGGYGHLGVRCHELATGASIWSTTSSFDAYAGGITAVGGELVVVGGAADDYDSNYPFIAVFTDAGAITSFDVDDRTPGSWSDVEPIGTDGDLILVGSLDSPCPADPAPAVYDDTDIAVRRIGPDHAEQWTRTFDGHDFPDLGFKVAVGPEEAILVGGLTNFGFNSAGAFGGRFAPDGTLLWAHVAGGGKSQDDARGAAFGPGFVVLAGIEDFGLYVHRLAADAPG